ncbi:MAG: FAD-dependent oxidoreductase [Desulfarculaceae bacterium]|nr:FAD-dependent oxidoreductase [Desulfarculaceae bacterium]
MQRAIDSLARERFDLVVVGGGIYGAAAAWEAARRGLKTALIESGDFGALASANSLKTIHSGFRYLQNLDLARLRVSSGELTNLLGMAPHLVQAVPCLVPTKGLGKQGRPAFAVALTLYNHLINNHKLRGRLLGKHEARALLGPCPLEGVTGAAMWYEGVSADSERLTLAYVQSAAAEGASAANYARALDLLREDGHVTGVRVRDELSGAEFAVQGSVVLLCAGVFNDALLGREAPRPALASAINVVLKDSLGSALMGVRSPRTAAQDPVCGAHRFMFMVPWQGRTMLGTAYRPWPEQARPAGPKAAELLDLLVEFNQGCPGLNLGPEDISFYHWGLVPLAEPGRAPGGGGLATKRLVEEESGLVAVSGAKYTTARAVAAEAVSRAAGQMGKAAPELAVTPLWGGDPNGEALPADMPPATAKHLRARYGSRAAEVAAVGQADAALLEPLAESPTVLGCEVAWAVEQEMALSLADVSLRRTMLGKVQRPSDAALSAAAGIMAARLAWDAARQEAEITRALEPYAVLEELK